MANYAIKASVDVLNNQLNVQLVRRLVTLNVAMMDEYWVGIQRVITREQIPASAISTIEN
jgi:hypothetical protein